MAIDVNVVVTEEQRPEGYLYKYRVTNKSSFAMGRLHLGEDLADGSVEQLRAPPLAVRAPEGWSGHFAGAEGLEGIAIIWSENDPPSGAFQIPPGGTLEGFEVVLPRLFPEYRTAVFSAFMTDAVHFVGNVTPAVASSDSGQPTVSITAPAVDATVSGSVVVSAQASDHVGVLDVQFKVDGRDLAEPVTAPPYTVPWNTLPLENRRHTLTAVARDAAGNRSTSVPVAVTVSNDKTPPTIRIAAPIEDAVVAGSTAFTASASAVHAILGVYFLVDGQRVGEPVGRRPYTVAWDTTTVPDGRHVLTASLIDASGAVVRSEPVAVTVRNVSDATPPTLSIAATPAVLWPPNHKLVRVIIRVNVSDDADPSPGVKLVSITCNDACNPAEDIQGAHLATDDREFDLRNERTGGGSSRTYTITYSATDASGKTATATTTVVVPHDLGKRK